MDIFKTLTRNTKLGAKKSQAQQSTLPSAGTNSNPQLFHVDIPDHARGKKRKRGGERKDSVVIDETEDVDFFAPKAPVSKTEKAEVVETNEAQLQEVRAPMLLDEEECRRILQSHRLKVTLLSTSRQEKQEKKNSKKQKVTAEKDVKHGNYERLFPQPLLDFAELRSTYGMSGRLNENMAKQGYKLPTEVQMASLPILLRPEAALGSQLRSGHGEDFPDIDLLAVAPTGSGKTLAFLIPIINNLLKRRQTSKSDGIQAIVVAPTKELASQIVNEGRKLCIGTGIKVVGMQKGMRVVDALDEKDVAESAEGSNGESESDEDEEQLTKKSVQPIAKADILITTPLTLLYSLIHATKTEGLPLPSVRHLVLDEADVLLDNLFREQTLGIWGACNNPELRVTLWSATMGSNIEALTSDTINARNQRLGIKTKSAVVRLVVGLKDTAIPNITQRLVYAATEQGKLLALRQLLHPTARSGSSEKALRPPFLVFTQTIPRAVALHSELQYDIPAEAGGSSRIAVLHSDLSDSLRDQVMTRFRNGEVWILITTDILSRGIDFKGINGVVNYDIPNSAASYIHRVGRTGRAGRNGGMAVTYYTKEDLPYVKNIANVIAASEKQAGTTDSDSGVQQWLLNALPKPSKKVKKDLKRHGVEARRSGVVPDIKSQLQISTKSGFVRQQENKRRGAIEGSKRRSAMVDASKQTQTGGEVDDEEGEDDEGK